MTLLISVLAAVVSTVVWYLHAPEDPLHVRVLCWLFWGASLMWLVDGVFSYLEEGTVIFTPDLETLVNDLFLGLCVAALALVLWLVVLLVKDPRNVWKDVFFSGRGSGHEGK